MHSLRLQFAFFALVLVAVVAGGGFLNYLYMRQAENAEQRVSLIAQAIETQMTGTFFNEEGRAIMHGARSISHCRVEGWLSSIYASPNSAQAKSATMRPSARRNSQPAKPFRRAAQPALNSPTLGL